MYISVNQKIKRFYSYTVDNSELEQLKCDIATKEAQFIEYEEMLVDCFGIYEGEQNGYFPKIQHSDVASSLLFYLKNFPESSEDSNLNISKSLQELLQFPVDEVNRKLLDLLDSICGYVTKSSGAMDEYRNGLQVKWKDYSGLVKLYLLVSQELKRLAWRQQQQQQQQQLNNVNVDEHQENNLNCNEQQENDRNADQQNEANDNSLKYKMNKKNRKNVRFLI